MAKEPEIKAEDAIAIVQRIRKSNRDSAKRYRKRMLREGYVYVQSWVPEEARDEARAALDKVLKKYENKDK